MIADYQLLQGDALTVLRTLPAGSVQTCVTSPPYYGLRDYGTASWEGGISFVYSVQGADANEALDQVERKVQEHARLKLGMVP